MTLAHVTCTYNSMEPEAPALGAPAVGAPTPAPDSGSDGKKRASVRGRVGSCGSQPRVCRSDVYRIFAVAARLTPFVSHACFPDVAAENASDTSGASSSMSILSNAAALAAAAGAWAMCFTFREA